MIKSMNKYDGEYGIIISNRTHFIRQDNNIMGLSNN